MRRLLTIGAFARAARLSSKALRLYDQLGLLRPAAVDDESGYRFYDPAQLERARLIAWLRRLGMPLARVRQVCDLPPPAAAEAVAGYWEQVLAETAARGQLATFLVDYLTGRGSSVEEPPSTLGIRYAARSELGLVRTSNEDSAYAGPRLLAVADGIRGPGGDLASAAAIDALKPLEALAVPADDLLGALADAVAAADRAIGEIAASSGRGGPGTTLTALLRSGSQLALAHIGDTRAYLMRDGEPCQITHDHTYVQSLVDEGRLTPEEAASHPQRSLLVSALTGTGGATPDLSLHRAEAGDRYVLCSDGLSAVVPAGALCEVLTGPGGPREVLDELVARAYAAGAPDNIACVVADVVGLDAPAAAGR
ncbi:MerR family transcriptional regulator [Streptomyces litchfieldiae]|uniref:MerR family transcriptional regulator n=1 Tax=Streptomyces litchfieldiae TaxID=3075543 RepID=A0ABU2MSB7_9ACTN|nr:MerR family transcriptional regulator [Streptomyces sp. DSM 44938]MDT0344538.1 MerR family transcriptional regulator [Streptomyces sp. DSM 44938]